MPPIYVASWNLCALSDIVWYDLANMERNRVEVSAGIAN